MKSDISVPGEASSQKHLYPLPAHPLLPFGIDRSTHSCRAVVLTLRTFSLCTQFTMDSRPKPSSFVFSNHLLVGKIMKFYEYRMENEIWAVTQPFAGVLEEFSKTRFFVKLRTLNRAFNSVVLHRFRKEYENLKVSVYQKSYDNTDIINMRLNNSLVIFERGRLFLNFLNQVAKVKVCNLIIDEVDDINSENENILHERLHELLYRNRCYINKFFGMKQLCEEGCDNCEYIADRCQKYGPLQLRVLLSDTRRHFKKCMNFDHDIASLAINLSRCSESREECLEMTEQMFDSNVSCDTLVLAHCENRYFLKGAFPPKTILYPWELVQTMLKNWKVKTVNLKFENVSGGRVGDSPILTDIDHFTKFSWQFPRDNGTELVSNVRLQNVRIDLVRSNTLDRYVFRLWRSYEAIAQNFISAARQMFPSDRYQIVPRSYTLAMDPIKDKINESYNFIWMDDPTDLNLDIAIFSYERDETDSIDQFFEDRQLTVTETEWSERVAQFPPGYPFESFDVKKGYSIRVEDPINNCVINYDVFIFFQ